LEDKSRSLRLAASHKEGPPGAKDLAVLVAISTEARAVANHFAASRANLPTFRAILSMGAPSGDRISLRSGGEAAGLAQTVVAEIRKKISEFRGLQTVHLFLSAPAGLALLIGQLLNTFPWVQLYEHVPGAKQPYRKALKFNPSTASLP
jgi:hypothetical protein